MHPVFNHVAPHGYLLHTVYFMADTSNPDLFVCGCRTWICLDITRFYEEQCQPSSGSAWLACPKNGKLVAGGFDTICTAVCIRCDSSTTCRMCHLKPCCSSSLSQISFIFRTTLLGLPCIFASIIALPYMVI